MGFHSLGLRVIDLSERRLKLHVVSTATHNLYYTCMLLYLVVRELPNLATASEPDYFVGWAFPLKILPMHNAGLPIKGSTHFCLP